MASPEKVGANVFAAAQEIAHGFFELGGSVNRRKRAGMIEDGELAGIAVIGFDAVARTAWDERRGNDVTGRGS